jgi:hypothetical protein
MANVGGKIRWGIGVVMVLLLMGLVWWLILMGQKPQPFSSRITLQDGTSARILAVTYGTNHVIGTKLARFAGNLPSVFQNVLRRIFGPRAVPLQTLTTPTPELLVWLDRRTNGPGRLGYTGGDRRACLGDGSNFVSGGDAFVNNYMPGFETEAIHFAIFPRRDREITLNIFDHNSRGIGRLSGSLAFANPLYRKYPEWQAEHLPASKRAGDVEVTLERVETGHSSSSTGIYSKGGGYVVDYDTDRSSGENYTVVHLKLRPLVNTNEIWQMAGAELSDATGNSAHSSSMSWSGGSPTFAFMPSLWPGEAAWKLKMELKRTEGFRPEEIFTFKKVPLGDLDRTNTVGWSTNVAGVTVTLQSIFRRAPMAKDTWSSSLMSKVNFTLSSLPEGTQLDLLRMVCDTGKTNLPESWGSSSNQRDYSYHGIPLDARTADFTFAIQQSRMVEFTVKPDLPPAKAESKK